jgi:hypothetical protein
MAMKDNLVNRFCPFAAITRLTLIEAWRGRSARLLILFLAAVYALGAFAASMAVTEGAETRLALAAHLYRLGLVLALALIVVSSTVRDMEGGFFQVLLAFPLSRAQFVVGRQAGYMLLAVLAAAAATAVMLSMAVPGGRAGVLAWGASLALELSIVVAAALFFSLGLRRVLPAFASCCAFYLWARLLDVARFMAAHPVGQDPTSWDVVAGRITFDLLGWLLPPLASFAPSPWTLGGPVQGTLLALQCGWALWYAALCAGASLIDLYRREV